MAGPVLRFLVLLLVLLNALYYVWSQGMLEGYGLAPVEQREPGRLKQQIHPEQLIIRPGG